MPERTKPSEPEPKGQEFFEAELEGEGLPEDYRFRNGQHYVDELLAGGQPPQVRLVPVTDIQGGGAANGGESLEGLTDSIQEFGVLQPLLVRRERGRYELLSGSKRLAAARKAGLKEVPCVLLEVDDAEARRLAEAANRPAAVRAPASRAPFSDAAASFLEGSLQTILSTLGLLERPESSLRDRVAVGLIRSEASHSSRMLRALRLLAADPPLVRRSIDLSPLAIETLSGTDEERGLLGIELDATIADRCVARSDERLVGLAFAGAVETVLALLGASRGATILVRLSANELTRTVSFVVSEDAVRLPTSSWARWFDLDWEKRPGGYPAAVALLAAKKVAELHRGALELAPTQAGGCQLRLTLPAD